MGADLSRLTKSPKDEDSDQSTDEESGNSADKDLQLKSELDGNEADSFWRIRLILMLALAAFTLATSLGLYFSLSGNERDDFEQQVKSDSAKILEGLASSMDNTLGAMSTYVSYMVAQQKDVNTTFPFVTVPHFGFTAANLLSLSGAYQFSTALFVTPDQRDRWEAYANTNNHWVEDTIEAQEKSDEWSGPTLQNYNTSYEILGITKEGELGPAPEPLPYSKNTYAALWQTAPLLEEWNAIPYNYDVWISEGAVPDILESVNTQRVVIAKSPNVVMDSNDGATKAYRESLATKNSAFVPSDQNPSEPVMASTYPIVDSKNALRIDVLGLSQNKVAGFLFFAMYWKQWLVNILPSESIGLVVVIEAPDCDEVFTYRLDGPDAVYLGAGDLHDDHYNQLVQSTSLTDILQTAKAKGGISYAGLPLSDSYCARTVRIYPSKATEKLHSTSKPALAAVLAALILAVASLVCWKYGPVAKRQHGDSDCAVAKTFFAKPQLHEATQPQLEKPKNKSDPQQFILDTKGEITGSKLEDLYKTSILFASIEGLTGWSAMHSQEDVKVLLETVYGAFDEIAKRRGVSKLETGGDGYVAVTGIPDAKEDHALVLCRFARNCMDLMQELKGPLAEELGSDTKALELRLGIHSGSVVASVLCGEKGRLQLSGTTMKNTASLMESNGVPGRIHVSQATADELTAKGKGHWLQARADYIFAHELGEIQTYFVGRVGIPAFVGRSTSTCGPRSLGSHRTKSIASGHFSTCRSTGASVRKDLESQRILRSNASIPCSVCRSTASARNERIAAAIVHNQEDHGYIAPVRGRKRTYVPSANSICRSTTTRSRAEQSYLHVRAGIFELTRAFVPICTLMQDITAINICTGENDSVVEDDYGADDQMFPDILPVSYETET